MPRAPLAFTIAAPEDKPLDARLAEVIESEASTPFDLVNGPLIRFTLVPDHGQDRHMLVMTAHHIVCDGWSMNILLDELGVLYSARLSGGAASLRAGTQLRRLCGTARHGAAGGGGLLAAPIRATAGAIGPAARSSAPDAQKFPWRYAARDDRGFPVRAREAGGRAQWLHLVRGAVDRLSVAACPLERTNRRRRRHSDRRAELARRWSSRRPLRQFPAVARPVPGRRHLPRSRAQDPAAASRCGRSSKLHFRVPRPGARHAARGRTGFP